MKKYDIYLIWSKDCDGNILRYYGSTCNFTKRKSNHKLEYEKWVKAGRPNNKKYSSFIILDKGDWKMEKIDQIEGERWEARKLEGEYQKNNECVNVKIECRTKKEYQLANKDDITEYQKDYYKLNKDKILEQVKEYRLAHKGEICKYQKEYYNLNKEVLAEKNKDYNLAHKEGIAKYQKEYRLANKNIISEKRKQFYNLNKEKITCECGALIAKHSLSKHRKTKKHINYKIPDNND